MPRKIVLPDMKDEIVLYQPNEQFQLEVQLKDETVWLNVAQIACLFERDRTVIARHIRNIYKERELDEHITCAKFAHMGADADQVYETVYHIGASLKDLGKKLFAFSRMEMTTSELLNKM